MVKEISDIKEGSVALYSQMNENQLKHIYEPDEGLFIAESGNVIERAMNSGYIPESFFVDKARWERAKRLTSRFPDADVYLAETQVISKITGFPLTGGILSAMRRKKLPGCDEILQGAKHVAVLEDVENPTNTGAIFRSAAALGIDALILTNGCADPLYRRAVRVSMGTVFQIPWTVVSEEESIKKLLGILRESGYRTVATSLAPDSKSIEQMRGMWDRKTAVFFGSEGKGLSEEVVGNCDHRVMIPMSGGVDSLNVAAASAVIFWEMAEGKRKGKV